MLAPAWQPDGLIGADGAGAQPRRDPRRRVALFRRPAGRCPVRAGGHADPARPPVELARQRRARFQGTALDGAVARRKRGAPHRAARPVCVEHPDLRVDRRGHRADRGATASVRERLGSGRIRAPPRLDGFPAEPRRCCCCTAAGAAHRAAAAVRGRIRDPARAGRLFRLDSRRGRWPGGRCARAGPSRTCDATWSSSRRPCGVARPRRRRCCAASSRACTPSTPTAT